MRRESLVVMELRGRVSEGVPEERGVNLERRARLGYLENPVWSVWRACLGSMGHLESPEVREILDQ